MRLKGSGCGPCARFGVDLSGGMGVFGEGGGGKSTIGESGGDVELGDVLPDDGAGDQADASAYVRGRRG